MQKLNRKCFCCVGNVQFFSPSEFNLYKMKIPILLTDFLYHDQSFYPPDIHTSNVPPAFDFTDRQTARYEEKNDICCNKVFPRVFRFCI